MDDREMVFRVWLQRPDGEIEISRRERNQKIRIRLFLNGDGLGVEAGDCRGKEDGCVSRFEGHRQVVDNEFIQRFLGNGPGVQLHRDQCEGYRDSGQFHAVTMARFSPSPAPDWGQSFAFGGQLKNFPLKFRPWRKFSPDKAYSSGHCFMSCSGAS
jgi:hypothetical protein